MLIAYDSRTDKISKIKNLFHLLRPSGTTPEGLCFEAIMKEIEPSSTDRDSYFLNFSDGMPMFTNDDIDYNWDTAINHTAKMVKEIKKVVLRLSVTLLVVDMTLVMKKVHSQKCMVLMQYIDVTSVLPVAKTMNKKFLQK